MEIAIILQRIRPGAVWSLEDNDYKTLVWKDSGKKPSLKEIESAWEDIQYQIQIEKNQEARKIAYQNESDPLFFEYQRGDVEKSVWLQKIKEIKERYPFPASSQQ
jgi:hypothetical protein